MRTRKASNAGTLRGFRLLWAFMLLGLTGCSRGCASRWLTDHGAGDRGKAAAAPFALGGTDCPGGLMRCEGGEIEESVTAHIPAECKAGEGACACPWRRVDECANGCVADGVVVDLPSQLGKTQLCRGPANAFTPAAGIAEHVCETIGYECVPGALIVKCEGVRAAARVVAKCVGRCVSVSTPLDDGIDPNAAAALLCVRN